MRVMIPIVGFLPRTQAIGAVAGGHEDIIIRIGKLCQVVSGVEGEMIATIERRIAIAVVGIRRIDQLIVAVVLQY